MPTRPEATEAIKRDDPSSALFLSGAEFKLDLEPRSVIGIIAQTQISQERHRIDDLLINAVRKSFTVGPTFDPRSMLNEPIDVRRVSGSVILDIPDRPDFPRLTITFENVDVDSSSSIELDLDLDVV